MDLSERHRAMFEPLGLAYAGTLDRVPNSQRAQILAELARDRGSFDALNPRLFDAYWGRGRDIGDEGVLIEEGTAVGLEEAEIREALSEGRYLDRIGTETRAAIEIGVTGVPAWLIDERFLVPGAQPHELFDQVMERTGHRPAESS
jgi:predicted DsbA family dithiol-disulfide isomerase